ncbi:MAG: hypothetical protein ACE5PV_07725 [Candidatus Poribacteria bacterium]
MSKKEVEICKTQKRENKDNLLSKANVIGVGVGPKIKNDRLTGDISVNVYVAKKVLDEKQLTEADIIPKEIKYKDGTVKTDVIQLAPLRAQEFTQRIRPAVGGCSGAVNVSGLRYTGTLGLGMRGYGRYRGRYFILSNNHVLANENRARIGDPVIQPGSLDGGTVENDVIGHLFDYVPLRFTHLHDPNPPHNTVDAAVAEVKFGDFNREIF